MQQQAMAEQEKRGLVHVVTPGGSGAYQQVAAASEGSVEEVRRQEVFAEGFAGNAEQLEALWDK